MNKQVYKKLLSRVFFFFICLAVASGVGFYTQIMFPEQSVRAQFQGPSCSAGNCNGRIATDSEGNIAIGTSTVSSTVQFLVVSPDTSNRKYGFNVVNPSGENLFSVSNDGVVTIPGTFESGSFSGSISAANVTPGVFNGATGGNYSFNGSVGVGTTTQVGLPQKLSVYGIGYFQSGISLGLPNGSYTLDNYGTSHFADTAKFEGFIEGYSYSAYGQGALLLRSGATNGVVSVWDYTGTTQLFAVYNNGNVSIGGTSTTTAPSSKFEVNGSVKIADGTQGSGKVLTSDSDGVASWQTPSSGGITNVVTFSKAATNTWTVPSGVSRIMIEVWGAGGGGGMGGSGGGGGAAGGYAKKMMSVTEGDQFTIVVGAGGGGSAVTTGQGTTGGTSSVTSPSGSSTSAIGGAGGYGSSHVSYRYAGGVGGTASGGLININGQDGSSAMVGASVTTGGDGGSAPFGGPGGTGGQGSTYVKAPTAGSWPGGGGGGGAWNGNPGCGSGCGGDGANGGVIITY